MTATKKDGHATSSFKLCIRAKGPTLRALRKFVQRSSRSARSQKEDHSGEKTLCVSGELPVAGHAMLGEVAVETPSAVIDCFERRVVRKRALQCPSILVVLEVGDPTTGESPQCVGVPSPLAREWLDEMKMVVTHRFPKQRFGGSLTSIRRILNQHKGQALTTPRTAAAIRSLFGKYAYSRFFAYGVGTSSVLTRTGWWSR